MMNTAKYWINDLAAIAAAKGMHYIIISPGSRNAPLTIAFSRQEGIECLSIPDERVAGFFALGMAQQLQEPVGLVCTSGTALLNYAPAIAEAYYQRIPLVVFSADRPNEFIDQFDSQTMRQDGAYANFIKQSYQLPNSISDSDDHWYSNRLVNEALNLCRRPAPGPVHINIPLKEPLYDLEVNNHPAPKIIEDITATPALPGRQTAELQQQWGRYGKKLLIVTGLPVKEQLKLQVLELAQRKDVAVLAEHTSNIHGTHIHSCVDPVLEAVPNGEEETYQPELLVTFGGPVVSKKIKKFLRKHQPAAHWHVDEAGQHIDTYQSLTHLLHCSPEYFMESVAISGSEQTGADYQQLWERAAERSRERHNKMLESAPYCDFQVYHEIFDQLPAGSNLQLANSTPVRYGGIFELPADKGITINANRGTSGIDGCTSTAAGAAYVNERLTTIITGDIGFFYDTNAFWHHHLPGNLRVILINNDGGNIFRIISGPDRLDELETFFETRQELSAEHLAATYAIPYYFCDSIDQLKNTLPDFYQPHNGKCVILEIKTPAEESARFLKNYLNVK